MGQARKRGSFEERREAAMTPEDRRRRDKSRLKEAMLMSIAGSYVPWDVREKLFDEGFDFNRLKEKSV